MPRHMCHAHAYTCECQHHPASSLTTRMCHHGLTPIYVMSDSCCRMTKKLWPRPRDVPAVDAWTLLSACMLLLTVCIGRSQTCVKG